MPRDFVKGTTRTGRALPYMVFGFLGIVIGGVLGLVTGGVLPVVYYRLTNPAVLNDGQWGMIYLASLPIGLGSGAVLGGVLACVVVRRMDPDRNAGKNDADR